MKKLFFALTAAVFFFIACTDVVLAQNTDPYPRDITLSWVHPTQYVDGTTIDPGDLKETRVMCERQNLELAFDVMVPIGALNPGDSQTHTVPDGIPRPGTYTCFAYSLTIDDISSDASAPLSKKYTGKPQKIATFVIE